MLLALAPRALTLLALAPLALALLALAHLALLNWAWRPFSAGGPMGLGALRTFRHGDPMVLEALYCFGRIRKLFQPFFLIFDFFCV